MDKKEEVTKKEIDCKKMKLEFEKCLKNNENENEKCNNFKEFILSNCMEDTIKEFIDM